MVEAVEVDGQLRKQRWQRLLSRGRGNGKQRNWQCAEVGAVAEGGEQRKQR